MIEINNPPLDVWAAAMYHILDIPDFVHCNLDAGMCCCRVHYVGPGNQLPADIFDHDEIRVALSPQPPVDFVRDLEVAGAAFDKANERYQLRPQFVVRPVHSGNSCHDCGGMMVRTGTCETCTECGTTGGCG